MISFKSILDRIVENGDPNEMILLQEMMEDLLEEAKDKKKYEMDLYKLAYGPHFNEEKLRDRKYACFGFAEKLIDSIDLFDKVVSYKPDNEMLRNYLIGFEMINNQLKQVLEAEGVTKINTKDQIFDPRYHNAVETDWDETKEENVILVEMKTGYMFKDRVLRASMVKVNKKPIEKENSKEEN